MAYCSGRAHVIKVALLAGILLLLLNFYNYRLESAKLEQPTQMPIVHGSASLWAKRTRTNSEISNRSYPIGVDQNSHATNNSILEDKTININSSSTATTNTSTDNNNNNFDKVILENERIPNFNESNKKHININVHNESNNKLIINDNSHGNISSNSNASKDQLASISPVESNVEQKSTASIWESTTNSLLLKKLMTSIGLNTCPLIPPNLDGPIEVNTTLEDIQLVEKRLQPTLIPGGWYKPKECNSKDRVAIIIPYRDRPQHLPVFLSNIHPFLQKQQIEYGIFIVEQIADSLFNRASLMNVGFVESQKLKQWDCFIFHDIDLLPMDDRNLYTCPEQPRHMSVAVDTMGFKLPYSSIFGGVSAMTVKQFQTVNGFSNSFWGWGGEDDDMSNRLKHVGYHIARYPVNIARYTMLSHRKEKANPKRYEKLVNGAKKFDVDGLNSLHYKVHEIQKRPLYTWVLAEINQETKS